MFEKRLIGEKNIIKQVNILINIINNDITEITKTNNNIYRY